MIKFLYFIFALALIGGISFVGYSVHRMNKFGRLVPVEQIFERVELALLAGSVPEKISPLIDRVMNHFVGECNLLKITGEGASAKMTEVDNYRFPFAKAQTLTGAGALCGIEGFGKPTLFSASGAEAVATFNRRYGKPIGFSIESGTLQVTSEQLFIEWRIPGLRVQLKSEGPVRILLRHNTANINLSVFLGKLNVELLKTERSQELALPVIVATTGNSTITSEGAVVADKNSWNTLLPTGFSQQSSSFPPAKEASP